MTLVALILVFLSTPMHAGWNLLGRRQRAEGAFFAQILGWGAVVGLGPVVVGGLLGGFMPGEVWVCVLISGSCAGAYFFFLAKGYAKSDFTVVYPIARALPVVLVGLGDILRGHDPSVWGWMGMSLVVIGCLLTPLRSLSEFHWQRYIHWPSLWMVLAAMGTVGYSLSDKVAAEVLSKGAGSAARYCYFFFLIGFLVYQLLRRVFGTGPEPSQKIERSDIALGAALNFGSYWLVLWAYQLVGRASYVVAFRQFSIVLGVVAAFAIYKERGMVVRITAAAMITAGLVIIGLWG